MIRKTLSLYAEQNRSLLPYFHPPCPKYGKVTEKSKTIISLYLYLT